MQRELRATSDASSHGDGALSFSGDKPKSRGSRRQAAEAAAAERGPGSPGARPTSPNERARKEALDASAAAAEKVGFDLMPVSRDRKFADAVEDDGGGKDRRRVGSRGEQHA